MVRSPARNRAAVTGRGSIPPPSVKWQGKPMGDGIRLEPGRA